ncbi:MAG: hypothetical protein QM690_19885 [Sphingobium sp.]
MSDKTRTKGVPSLFPFNAFPAEAGQQPAAMRDAKVEAGAGVTLQRILHAANASARGHHGLLA